MSDFNKPTNDDWQNKPAHRPAENVATPQESDGSGDTQLLPVGYGDDEKPSHDRSVGRFIGVVALLVPLMAGWFYYFSHPTWYFGVLAILVGIAWWVVAKRIEDSSEVAIMSGVVMVCLGWSSYFVHPTPLMHALAWASLVFILFCILRLVRGSLDEAEAAYERKLNEPAKPSKKAARNLIANEVLWQEKRRHPACLTPWWLLFLVLTVCCFRIGLIVPKYWLVILIVWGIAALLVFGRLLAWWDYHFCWTSRRLLSIRGVFTEKVSVIPNKKIPESTLSYPWHSRLLAYFRLIGVKYGNWRFDTSSEQQDLERVTFVPGAQAMNRKYASAILEPTTDDTMEQAQE